MSVYQPPSFQSPIDLDLSRNEGRAMIGEIDLDVEAVDSLVRRYPDTSRLTRLIAGRHGVDEDRVLITAGGDDAIFRTFLGHRGKRVVATTPTFEMIPRYAEQAGVSLVEVPWWDGELPIDDLAGVEAEMAVIVSPNNPTGSTIRAQTLQDLAARYPLVLLDAAYAEFADIDLTPVAACLDNVVVVRTLSKAFGLAGLRVGYLLGAPGIVSEVGRFGSPYAVSGLSAALAADVLDNGQQRVDGLVKTVVAERDGLFGLLTELGTSPLPSQANFVLATNTDPESMVSGAASLGVGLRRFPGRPGLERCVRISLPGDADEFDRLASALRAVLAPDQEPEVADVS